MEEKQTKKTNWSNLSPTISFVFGICTGIAIFAVLSLIYSYLVLLKTGTPKVAVNLQEPEIKNEEVREPIKQSVEERLEPPKGTPFNSFIDTGKQICKENGKPVIYLFSTTWCPHCNWIKDVFDKVAKDYVKKGKIVAYHWQLDTGDNTLTEEVENSVPQKDEAIYNEFNPSGSIPTFVFGCRYYRIGNAYEREGDAGKEKEEKEFRKIIEVLIKS
jgi:thiol-disulfide isomerase/thioredoxin